MRLIIRRISPSDGAVRHRNYASSQGRPLSIVWGKPHLHPNLTHLLLIFIDFSYWYTHLHRMCDHVQPTEVRQKVCL